ncbi:hypothetical protein CcCBS67573_g04081 [Chytriomyces confervae]|uniref:Uncharacterized protein n=1 Tax=Chytriomyces confervae TaxID=246404 RepID=A0A507FE92_9FUNG|nr:hypothetical protein CcCBS67573_g04081 [Chytriomyces confervae]
MLLAAITAVLASAASAHYCAPSMASCQIQSDPFVNTFQSTIVEVHTTGTMYALQSKDMNVQVTMATKQRNGQAVIIVDSVTFACGNETPQTFTIETVGKAPRVLSCKAGSCSGTTCTAVILEGSDPVPNVQVQEIRYFGTMGTGGICYDKDSKCPSTETPPTEIQPSPSGNGCSGGDCPPASVSPSKTPVSDPPATKPPAETKPVKTTTSDVPTATPPAPMSPSATPIYNPPMTTPPAETKPVKTTTYEVPMVTPPAPMSPSKTAVYNPPMTTPPAEIKPVKTPTYEVPMVTPPAAEVPPKCSAMPSPAALKTPTPADMKATYVAQVVRGTNGVLVSGSATASAVSIGIVAVLASLMF